MIVDVSTIGLIEDEDPDRPGILALSHLDHGNANIAPYLEKARRDRGPGLPLRASRDYSERTRRRAFARAA